jgi:hypothetical protein
MNPQKNVIDPKELPTRFELGLWIAFYLLLERFEANWISIAYWSLFSLWTLVFLYLKQKEQKMSIANLRTVIERFLNE